MKYIVYDIESYPNFFCCTFDEITYEISERKDDSISLYKYIQFIKKDVLVGFNNLNYDSKFIWFFENYIDDLVASKDKALTLNKLSDQIINTEALKHEKSTISQLDLYKLYHFDNRAKRTSLKHIEIALNLDSVQDLPYPPGEDIPIDAFDEVIKYNKHDVYATRLFYENKKTQSAILLRQKLSDKYSINSNYLQSCSDSAIGRNIIQKEYKRLTGIDFKNIEPITTDKNRIGDVIADNVSFTTPVLKSLLDRIKGYSFHEFSNISFLFKDLILSVAKGGLHSKNKPNFYYSNDNYVLKDLDFGSYYPYLLIALNAYPAHLGESFIVLLKQILDTRIKAKKLAKEDYDALITSESLKITVNTIYGELGSDFSKIRDLASMYTVTINGQLYLLMLMELLSQYGECFYANTDGLTFKLDRRYEGEFLEKAQTFANSINIPIEFANFNRAFIRDCNNYIIEKEDGELKRKGLLFSEDREWHKNHSMKVVSKALSDYFIKDIPYHDTIDQEKNIFNFCLQTKFKKGTYGMIEHRDKKENVGKHLRYVATRDGGILKKYFTEGVKADDVTIFHKGFLFENMNEIKSVNIDKTFYYDQTGRIINLFTKQTSLF